MPRHDGITRVSVGRPQLRRHVGELLGKVSAPDDDDDELCIACPRKLPPRPAPAAGWTRCNSCHAKVWIAPASIAIAKTRTHVTIMCLECVGERYLARLARGERLDIVTTAQQEIEMFQSSGETVSEILARFGITPRKIG